MPSAPPAILARGATGADRQDLRDRVERAADGTRVAEGAEIGRAIVDAAAGAADARPGVVQFDLDVGVLLVAPPLDVIARGVAADQLRFEDQRLQFGADDDRLDPRDRLQQPRFLRLPERLRVVGADPVAEVLGLADVDDRVPGVAHQVAAGEVRDRVEPGGVHHRAPAPAPGLRLLPLIPAAARPPHAQEIVQRVQPSLRRTVEEGGEDGGGEARVRLRTVPILRRAQAEGARHRVEIPAPLRGEDPLGQRQGVEAGVERGRASGAAEFGVEEGEVECDVVADDQVVAEEGEEGVHDRRERGCIDQQVVGDVRQRDDLPR